MKLLDSKVIAVGGGKGGVGKSFIASNIACGLAMSGRSVVIVDADLAGANIHTLFGIKYPERTLSDFLKKKVPAFTDILLDTPLPNLKLICGASDLLEIANPHHAQKQQLIGEITRLNADMIIIDIGAGASLNNLDFFNAADTGIIVTTPSPPALQNAYGFLKMAVHRKILRLFSGNAALKSELTEAFAESNTFKSMKHVLDLVEKRGPAASGDLKSLLSESRYQLIVNMSTAREGDRVAQALCGVAYQYLDVHLDFFGTISFDAMVENSVRKMEPLLLTQEAAVSDLFMNMAEKLINDGTGGTPSANDRTPATVPRFKSNSQVQLCLHDEVLFQGTKLHVQTEDFGMDKAQIVSLVFSGGEILFSRKADYREMLAMQDVQNIVTERVKAQHSSLLSDIRNGVIANELSERKGP
jgi:flagellar biosynthesis protein FlhG